MMIMHQFVHSTKGVIVLCVSYKSQFVGDHFDGYSKIYKLYIVVYYPPKHPLTFFIILLKKSIKDLYWPHY